MVIQAERGEHLRDGDAVSHQTAGLRVAALCVQHRLTQSLSDALRDASVDLSIDYRGVDHRSAVVHG